MYTKLNLKRNISRTNVIFLFLFLISTDMGFEQEGARVTASCAEDFQSGDGTRNARADNTCTSIVFLQLHSTMHSPPLAWND
jgi:hypothetical protein